MFDFFKKKTGNGDFILVNLLFSGFNNYVNSESPSEAIKLHNGLISEYYKAILINDGKTAYSGPHGIIGVWDIPKPNKNSTRNVMALLEHVRSKMSQGKEYNEHVKACAIIGIGHCVFEVGNQNYKSIYGQIVNRLQLLAENLIEKNGPIIVDESAKNLFPCNKLKIIEPSQQAYELLV